MDQAIENKILERPKLLKSLPLFISFVVVEKTFFKKVFAILLGQGIP
jgi:hypothetical protein